MALNSEKIMVGTGADARDIAILRRDGGEPGLFWLGGFKSDMVGSKAESLDALGSEKGWAVTRFDYSGHGISGGDFLDGTLTRWLDEALAVFATTKGKQIVVGSSMGGNIAMLLAQALHQRGEAERLAGIVLIAPAVDMTRDLMRKRLSADQLAVLEAEGRVELPSEYSDEPYIYTKKLLDDGDTHVLFGKGTIRSWCPVHILQGGQDPDVPADHAIKLLSHLTLDPAQFTLIPDGDHRLSRPEDLAKLRSAIEAMVEG